MDTFIAVVGVATALTGFGFYFQAERIATYLGEHHPEVLTAANPSILKYAENAEVTAVMRLVASGQLRKLNDPHLSKLCATAEKLMFAVASLFLCFAVYALLNPSL